MELKLFTADRNFSCAYCRKSVAVGDLIGWDNRNRAPGKTGARLCEQCYKTIAAHPVKEAAQTKETELLNRIRELEQQIASLEQRINDVNDKYADVFEEFFSWRSQTNKDIAKLQNKMNVPPETVARSTAGSLFAMIKPKD